MGTNLIARINAATNNPTATLLMQRIAFYCRLETGGVMFDGRRWSYRSVEGWADEIAETSRTSRRALSVLKERHLTLTRMAWVGKKEARIWVLHVALTPRAEALLDGSDPMAMEGGDSQKWSDPTAKSGETVIPKMAALYKEPFYLPVDLPLTLSEPQKLAEKDQSSSEGFPGKEEGKESEEQAEKGSNAVKAEKMVKSVKDVEAAVKAQAVLHKPNTTTALAFIWKKRVAEITKAPAVFKGNDFHKLTNFRKACPFGTAAEAVLDHVLDDWIMFVKKVETMAGEKNTPSVPNVGFLLRHVGIAVILATPKKPPPLKHEATSGGPSAKLMQLASLSPTPKPEVQKPQSLAEIWADPDEDDE